MSDETDRSPEHFDCLAFQAEQRKRLSAMFSKMSHREIYEWQRDYRPTDPILRRFWDRQLAYQARKKAAEAADGPGDGSTADAARTRTPEQS